MKERLLSNRYNEERLKLQRHHDELLQKVLYNSRNLRLSLLHLLVILLGILTEYLYYIVTSQILDKKTKEVEEFRSEYRNKVLQLENNNKTLERRLQQVGLMTANNIKTECRMP